MKTIELNYDAEYASEVMDTIPAGYINKTVCGCGLTTVAIENKEDSIIAVPNIELANNKAAQYPNNRCDFKLLSVWGEVTKEDVDEYVTECMLKNQPVKILVTYDGLHKVEHLLDVCRLIIDESDQILSLTKNAQRREAIFHLLEVAESLKTSVSFLSATPIDLKYMPQWISEIDQVTMNWSNTIKAKPILAERTYPYKALKEEFIKPLQRNGYIDVAGKRVKKVIVFVNSLSTIASIIKETRLNVNDCAVICGDSIKNDIKLDKIKRFVTGTPPKYLFVTSSGFSGIDIYDDESMTIVVSNTAKAFTMVDMMTDLKQAISRNRSKVNPNYGHYIYIYNQSIFNKTEEVLMDDLNNFHNVINSTINVLNAGVLNNELIGVQKLIEDSKDVLAYTKQDVNTGLFKVNETVFNADKYFILELRKQYTEGFNIQGATGAEDVLEAITLPKSVTYEDLCEYFNKFHKKGVCDWDIYSTKTEWISIIESYYRLYGKIERNISRAKQMIDAYGNEYKIATIKLRSLFLKGERYTNKDIKETLTKAYNDLNINRKAKATDIYELFGETGVKSFNTKGIRGIEIL